MTEVQIANMALTMLGADTITTFADATEQARALSAIYSYTRSDMLREYPWSWAIKRDELEEDSSSPEYGYTYQHTLPEDCLRVLEINNGNNALTDYRIEGNLVLSDYNEIYIRYIAEVDDDTITDSNFCHAFATRLAAELAFKLTSSATLASNLMEMAIMKLSKAKAANAQEANVIDTLGDDDWELGRQI